VFCASVESDAVWAVWGGIRTKRPRRRGKDAYTLCDTPGCAVFPAVENTFALLLECGSPRACFRNVVGGAPLLVALRALPGGVMTTIKMVRVRAR
jgi:hypothetical protein